MESVFLITAIVGFVELVKAISEQNVRSIAIILGSAAIGAITGFFGIDGLTVATGLQAGLAASGTYTIAEKI